MIVAKTRMKNIPNTCKKCSLSNIVRLPLNESYRVCAITGYACPTVIASNGCMSYKKPKDCPLIEMVD